MASPKAANPKKTPPPRTPRAQTKPPAGATTAPRKSRATKAAPRPPSRKAAAPLVTLDGVIDVLGILLAVFGVLTALAMVPSDQPSMAQGWLNLLVHLFGSLALAAPLTMIVLGGWLIVRRFEAAPRLPRLRLIGGLLFAVALFGLLGMAQGWRSPTTVVGYGGVLGQGVARLGILALGRGGGTLALVFLAGWGLLLLLDLSLADIGRAVARLRQRVAPKSAHSPSTSAPRSIQLPLPALPNVVERIQHLLREIQQRLNPAKSDKAPAPSPRATPTAPYIPSPIASDSVWQLPPWRELLEERAEAEAGDEDIRRKTHLIEETLTHFGVPARVVEINRGPTVTQFGLEPGFVRRKVRGEERELKVKVSAITHLHNDLALALAAPSIRIEAPVPGRPFVGIEVPNDRAAAVTLRGAMESEEFGKGKSALRLALGMDVMGAPVVADLAKMPHLLIAGATGSGKSVCVNAIICCLLCQNTPDQLKLLMVDPKTVELTGYNGIPHLIVPVVTDTERVVGLLRWTVNEMERRYKLFSEARVRHLEAYNERAVEKGERALPFIVVLIDELADLMMAAADQVEGMLCRLAQMARATGIHLIVATQRPSVDVVTGLIKANFPSRIAFAVTSQVDSRVILDRPGAETLLGRGDMLYMASDSGSLRRAQGCFVSDAEITDIHAHWVEQASHAQRRDLPRRGADGAEPLAVQAVLWDELLADPRANEEDDLLPKAREVVAQAGSASVSMLQRRLRVGYARAARLVDLLEEEGTIGAGMGPGKTRSVRAADPEPGSDEDPGYDPAWVHED